MSDFIQYFVTFCFILSTSGEIQSQALPSDQVQKRKMLEYQLSNLSAYHDSLFDPFENLINGRLFSAKGDLVHHPYYLENNWNPGKIWCDGSAYEAMMLKYDLLSDILIHVFRFDSTAFPVILNKEIVRGFEINRHRFIYLDDFKGQENDKFRSGYYEVVYDAGTCLYLRHEKRESQNIFTLETEYIHKIYYYIKNEGKYILIKNRKDLLNSLRNYETEIRLFIKKKNLRFSINNYDSIIKILEYYDMLKLL